MTTFALTCLILSIITWLSYAVYIYIKYQPDCFSRSYYLIKHKGIFTLWIILVSFLIFPAWVEISPLSFQFLPFLSVVALGSVGVNPRYLHSDKTAHIVSACIAVVLSVIWNIVTAQYIVPLILVILVSILGLCKAKNLLFWSECAAFLNIYLSILLS